MTGRTADLTVLAVIDSLGQGGTERSLAESIPPLADREIRVVVAIAHQRRGVEDWLRDQGGDVRVLPTGWRRWPAYRRLVREVRPDVVHSMLFASNLLTRLCRPGLRVPLLTSLVNTSYTPDRFTAPGIDARKLRVVQAIDVATGWAFVDAFHAVSEAVAADAATHLRIPPDRLVVVGRGRHDPLVDLAPGTRAAVRAELGLPDDAVVAVSVGRHELQKDHVTLLRAMAPILAERPEVRLLIAGREGSATPQLRAERAALADPSSVLVLGNRTDMPRVLAASDLLLLTSRHEGMPGALIEAMAMALPAVASDIAPVHEVAVVDGPGMSAVLAPVGDVGAFERAIRTLVDDPDARSRLGANGRARYEAGFTIDVAADGMARLYREVARGELRRRRRPRTS